MTIRTVFAVVAIALFAVAAAASVRQSLAPSPAAFDHSVRASNHKPYFMKGRIVDGCFDHSPDCVLLAW